MIVHVDADSFFASVLQRKHPHLRGKPLLARGMGGSCVIAASYEAKAKGVRTGMRIVEAKRLCPGAIEMDSDFAETGLASKQIESIIESHCPVFEQYSIDEWYLDLKSVVGGVPFDLLLWAKELQNEISKSVDLSVSIGIAPSKILAKMAGEEKKPAGLTVIEKHEIESFLGRRPIAAIPGIGKRREAHTKAKNWESAWDYASADAGVIRSLFHKPGLELQRELLGEAVSPVTKEYGPPKSISRTRSFRATNDAKLVWAHAMQHLSYTVLKMRTKNLSCRSVSLWLRMADYRHDGLQVKLPQAMDTEEEIAPYVKKAFDRLLGKHNKYTQVGLCLWNLGPKGAAQFSLFESPMTMLEDESVQNSLDSLRKKYGREVVVRGSALPVHKQRMRGFDVSMFG